MLLNTFPKSEAARSTARVSLVFALTIAAATALGGCAVTASTNEPGISSSIGISSNGDGKGAVSRYAIPGGYSGSNYSRVPGR